MKISNDDEERLKEASKAELRERLAADLSDIAVPDEYEIRLSGVYSQRTRDFITRKPFWVVGVLRKPEGGGYSMKVAGWGYDNKLMTARVEFDLLHGRPSAVLATLDKAGFPMAANVGKALVRYLKEFREAPQLVEVDRTGWHETSEGEAVFVLPSGVLGGDGGEVTFDIDALKGTELARAMNPSGTLQDWVDHVAIPVRSNAIPMVTIMHSLSASLRWPLESEFLGLHYRGPSSIGKSIALGIGSSVWGCGAPPGGDRPTFTMTWNGTQNSLERTCHSRNDLLLSLDEIGEFSGDLARFIYMVSGGRGKSRMRSDATLRDSIKWRAPLLSTGEKSIEDVIQEDGRQKAKAGQFIRVLNVECGGGIFTDTKGQDPETFVNSIRDACGQYHSTAGISFLKHLFGEVPGKDIEPVDVAALRERWNTITQELQLPHLQDQQKRVIRRLGVVALAGAMAVDFGILPYTYDEVIAAVAAVRDMWLSSANVLSDAARAARDLKEFLEDNLERRIQEYSKDAPVIRDRVAFRTRLDGRDLFLFSRVAFRRATGTANTDEVCRYLADHDLLHMNSKPRYQSRFSPIEEILTGDEDAGRAFSKGSKISFYAVESRILNFDFGAQPVAAESQPPLPTRPGKPGAKPNRTW